MSRVRSLQKLLPGVALAALSLCLTSNGWAGSVPGRLPEGMKPPEKPPIRLSLGLNGHYTTTGRIALSVDGLGTLNPSGWVQVLKPAGATVRAAFLAAATTGFSGAIIPNGAVTLDGAPVTWDSNVPNTIGSRNYLADVTALVAPTLNAAPAGLLNLTVGEGALSSKIDGSILAVVFDDPAQATDRTISLFFGALDVNGDAFNIGLAEPARPGDAAYVLDLSLGISFGFQDPTTRNQISRIDVNGTRMTSSAGGQDDGQSSDGALVTVGGLGDSHADPADPLAPPTNFDADDELYDLKPFVKEGDQLIRVTTVNPSLDDNIFFAALLMSGSALVNEGVVLTPNSATGLVGEPQQVTAILQSDDGARIPNRPVSFRVISGPHAGRTGGGVTGASGEVDFGYVGLDTGTDAIEASFVNNAGSPVVSNPVTRAWVRAEACVQCPPAVAEPVVAGHAYAISFPFCNCAPAGDTFSWCLSDDMGWNAARCDSTRLEAGGCATPVASGTVPMKLAAGDTNRFVFILTCRSNPAHRDTCVVRLPIRPPIVSVVLARLDAESLPEGVRLTWETSAETDHGFFNVLRAAEGGTEFARLNVAPIRGSGVHEFVDATAPAGGMFLYRIEAVDRFGVPQVAGEIRVAVTAEGALLRLQPGAPNPFTTRTTLGFTLARSGPVRVQIFDLAGRLVRTLVDRELPAGAAAVAWDARDDAGARAPAGLYLVRVRALDVEKTLRLVRIH